MQIQINTAGIKNSEALEEHVHAQLDATISRFADRLTRIEVHLGDENGRKSGGHDKRCMIEARPRGRDPLAVETFGDDLYETISDAAGKLRRVLESRLERD